MCGRRADVTLVELFEEHALGKLQRLTAEGTNGQENLFRRFGIRERRVLVLRLAAGEGNRGITEIVIRQGLDPAGFTVEFR